MRISSSSPRWVAGGLLALAIGCVAFVSVRARQEPPEFARIVELLRLAAGQRVADVGAGEGDFTRRLAEHVGPSGRVFATEVTADLVKKLEALAGELPNVTAIRGTQTDTGLPEDCCDAILLRLVYHHFTEAGAMRASLDRALKPGALIAVIDFPPNDSPSASVVPADRGGHGIAADRLIAEMTAAGFTLVHRVDGWPGGRDRYGLVFRGR